MTDQLQPPQLHDVPNSARSVRVRGCTFLGGPVRDWKNRDQVAVRTAVAFTPAKREGFEETRMVRAHTKHRPRYAVALHVRKVEIHFWIKQDRLKSVATFASTATWSIRSVVGRIVPGVDLGIGTTVEGVGIVPLRVVIGQGLARYLVACHAAATCEGGRRGC
jgi:hypothetical protein